MNEILNLNEFERIPPEIYFSRLPADFRRDWLPARVENLNWPPTQRYQGWTKVLGDTPERWRHYRWREGTVDLSRFPWRADVDVDIHGLTDACFRGVSNSWARFLNQSFEKIGRLQQYALTHRALPARLLIAKTQAGNVLVDGYHRVSWFLYASALLGPAFPVSPIANCYFGQYEGDSPVQKKPNRSPSDCGGRPRGDGV